MNKAGLEWSSLSQGGLEWARVGEDEPDLCSNTPVWFVVMHALGYKSDFVR